MKYVKVINTTYTVMSPTIDRRAAQSTSQKVIRHAVDRISELTVKKVGAIINQALPSFRRVRNYNTDS